jgi:hypothetical protein
VLTSAEFPAGLAVAEAPVVEEDEGVEVEVDLLDPKDKGFEKPTAETEQVDPAARGQTGRDVSVVPEGARDYLLDWRKDCCGCLLADGRGWMGRPCRIGRWWCSTVMAWGVLRHE